MSFAAPWALWLAAAGALAVVALHLIVRRRRTTLLPTARFVPETPAGTTTRALRRRPADLGLLALRVTAVLLLGAAFAGPSIEPARTPLARVVVLDVSRAAGDAAEARDSAAAWLREGDALVVFDSAARIVATPNADSLAGLSASSAAGSLSAALLGALRAGAELQQRSDSVELVVVSAFAAEGWDAATERIRELWPGGARLVRTASAALPAAPASVELSAPGDDPLHATLALLGEGAAAAPVRIRRDRLEPGDLEWARGAQHVLLHWPAAADPGAAADTIGAVAAGDAVVVAPFARGAAPPPGRVVARWADGAAAATERPEGEGCVRHVAVPLAGEGDLALRESMRRFLREMLQSCGGARRLEPLADEQLAVLAGEGGAARLHAPGEPGGSAAGRRLGALLLGTALALLLVEIPLRRGGTAA
jgi:hypothetical protein